MLKKLYTFLPLHVQAASNSLNSLLNKPLATTMTIVVIAIALTLPSLFWVFTGNIAKLTKNWQPGGHISLYLQPNLSQNEASTLLNQIQIMPNVGKATLKTSQEGLEELQQQEGMESIMQYLPSNPLPAVIEVTPAISVQSPPLTQALLQQLSALPHVEQAKLDLQWLVRLQTLLSFATQLTKALMILLASAVILIVGNALRLAIHYQQEEIRVLKLIGATDSFIIRPFLYSALWYGLGGSVLAILFINIFLLSIAVVSNALATAYHMSYPFMGLSIKQAYMIVCIAIILSWIGARLVVKRQLTSIEPCH